MTTARPYDGIWNKMSHRIDIEPKRVNIDRYSPRIARDRNSTNRRDFQENDVP